MGSPPRMRGKGPPIVPAIFPIGITPAHAGKRGEALRNVPAARDHPRTCGEKEYTRAEDGQLTGSPPHMRGKVRDFEQRVVFGGITPAHAGKSHVSAGSGRVFEDHPRTCGEKLLIRKMAAKFIGSPPHMRGKGGRPAAAALLGRITPAHAGKSSARLTDQMPRGDHPRTCGEKLYVHRFRCS